MGKIADAFVAAYFEALPDWMEKDEKSANRMFAKATGAGLEAALMAGGGGTTVNIQLPPIPDGYRLDTVGHVVKIAPEPEVITMNYSSGPPETVIKAANPLPESKS